MPKHFRIATWNLDRSGVRATSRIPRQLDKIQEINADFWILTKTHSSIALQSYEPAASQRDPNCQKEGESHVTIWSRFPLRKIETADPVFTVCAELTLPSGHARMLLYGSIITNGSDGVSDGAARPWERHRAAVRQQTKEWLKLRMQYPDHVLCIAGDFNESLDGTRGYGVADARKGIKLALVAGGMRCATDVNMRAPPFNLKRATVDHICVSDNARAAVHVGAWEGTAHGLKLSDRNGVLVDLEFPG
jgi:hypothetical protein